MKPTDGGLWVLIASTANEPEVEEIARLIGTKRIKDNEVRMKPVCFIERAVIAKILTTSSLSYVRTYGWRLKHTAKFYQRCIY
jgi:hypothetical protein